MGNRAVITQSTDDNAPCIYLHWNGGRASVEGFLSAARDLGLAGSGQRHIDALADLITRRFFKVSPMAVHVYREPYGRTDRDNGDNGVYVIDENFEIVERRYLRDSFCEEVDAEKTAGIRDQIVDGDEDLSPYTYGFRVNLDERGEFSATVWDESETIQIYNIESADQMREMIDDGFMAHTADIRRLALYLSERGLIPDGAQIIDSPLSF